MRCFHCNKEMTHEEEMSAVLLDADGDFVHDSCEEPYKKARDHFLNVTVQSESKFLAWMGDTDE
jgi:hypothetical protein